MKAIELPSASSKPERYAELAQAVRAVIDGEPDFIANLANVSALIFHSLADVNWAGFYLLKGGELVVGPFQGQVACVRIPLGKGVCGTAAATRRSIVVPDVRAFPGHIACDTASSSEIVLPMIREGELLGVLDIDSPTIGRFDQQDQEGLEQVVAALLHAVHAVPDLSY